MVTINVSDDTMKKFNKFKSLVHINHDLLFSNQDAQVDFLLKIFDRCPKDIILDEVKKCQRDGQN